MSTIKPLQGLRVLDFSWVWSGPLVTSILAELGAEVIKVEHGQRLDNSRLRGRPLRDGKPVEGPSIETGPYYHQTNHGKLSITINLKSPEASGLLDRLVAESDIVVENLSPGALSRAGLGYKRLSAISPRLIYLSMSAAGQTGPLSGLKAYAPIMSSYCGFETLVGYPGELAMGMMNFGYGDANAAVHGLIPLLAAIHEAQDTGQGQHIDMSQIEALLSVIAEPQIDRFMNGRDALPMGNSHPAMAPHGIYPASGTDRWVSIAVADDTQWQALGGLIGRPAWAADTALATVQGRIARREAIDAALGAWTAGLEQAELVRRLREAGIACSPVQDIAAQWTDPHFDARRMRRDAVHPITGLERLYCAPWLMEENGPDIHSSAPILGADNERIFGGLLGIGPDELARLKADDVLT